MLIIRLVDRNTRILSGLGSGLSYSAKRIVPQAKAADRIGPWHDRRDFRSAVRVSGAVLRLRTQVVGAVRRKCAPRCRGVQRHTACARRKDGEAVAGRSRRGRCSPRSWRRRRAPAPASIRRDCRSAPAPLPAFTCENDDDEIAGARDPTSACRPVSSMSGGCS